MSMPKKDLNLNETIAFIQRIEPQDMKGFRSMLNATYCSMKERAKDQVCAGQITEKQYRELRLVEALLSFIESDLDSQM